MSKNMKSSKWIIVRRFVQISVIAILFSQTLGATFFRGTLVSATFFGIPLFDPLAGLDYIFATKSIYFPMLSGIGIVVLFYFLVGGRVFCGWVCPVYLLSELSAKLPRKLIIFRVKTSLSTRFWFLAIILVLSLLTSKPVFETISPIRIFSENLAYGIDPPATRNAVIDGSEQTDQPSVFDESSLADLKPNWIILFNSSLLLIALILLIDIFIKRGWWCRYTCPLGAIYTLIGKYSPVKVRIDHAACDQCGDCFKVCLPSEVLREPVMGDTIWIKNSSCTNCLNCVDICHTNALKLSLKTIKERKQ